MVEGCEAGDWIGGADGWIGGIARGWIVGLVDGWIDGRESDGASSRSRLDLPRLLRSSWDFSLKGGANWDKSSGQVSQSSRARASGWNSETQKPGNRC